MCSWAAIYRSHSDTGSFMNIHLKTQGKAVFSLAEGHSVVNPECFPYSYFVSVLSVIAVEIFCFSLLLASSQDHATVLLISMATPSSSPESTSSAMRLLRQGDAMLGTAMRLPARTKGLRVVYCGAMRHFWREGHANKAYRQSCSGQAMHNPECFLSLGMTEGGPNHMRVDRSAFGSFSSRYPVVSAGGKFRQTVSILCMLLAKSPVNLFTTVGQFTWFWVLGLEFRVWGLGFNDGELIHLVLGLGFRV